jgi:Protein of unknown function (DUF2958)
MTLITDEQRKRLLHNGRFNTFRRERGEFEIDYKPVVKLHAPTHPYLCLLSEIDPDDPDRIYGLWDTGRGPKLGYGSLFIVGIVRDIRREENFVPTKSIGEYAQEAFALGRIIG